MRRNKLLVCLLCIVLMVFCCSCGFASDEKYICDVNDVINIQIVRMNGWNEEEKQFDYTVLVQVSDYEPFVEQLNQVEHREHRGAPSVYLFDSYEYIVVKVDYRNGDCDFIHPDVQVFFFADSDKYQTGYFYFDEAQFNALISEHLPD